jgi:formamidopyrimidine-DNA glycosylase
MPELPEVELVAVSLNNLVSRRKIAFAELLRQRLAPLETPQLFDEKLTNSKINFVHRRGKHVLFDLDSGRTLITHLRMSGRFLLLSSERQLPKHAHAVLYFEDDTRLVFQDQRHFGMMKIVATENLREAKEIKNLAPEPFSEDFTPGYLRETLSKSKKSLKEVLLDQTKVCGLGNIYASESLFLARVDPRISANRLSAKKINLLFEKIREVLAESIAHGSTMNVNPENIDGSYYGGQYEGHWRVYDQEKNPCSSCRTEIKRITQGGRSTYFCPRCQK